MDIPLNNGEDLALWVTTHEQGWRQAKSGPQCHLLRQALLKTSIALSDPQ